MAEQEKQIIQNMAQKQYFVGFAEGVAAMASQIKEKPSEG